VAPRRNAAFTVVAWVASGVGQASIEHETLSTGCYRSVKPDADSGGQANTVLDVSVGVG
jgi:hypothetical protein